MLPKRSAYKPILQCSVNECCCLCNFLLAFYDNKFTKLIIEIFKWFCHLVIFCQTSKNCFRSIVLTLYKFTATCIANAFLCRLLIFNMIRISTF